MGSSMAENHPVGFQWVIEAREKNGAKIIHVDPRFTRTSAMADYWLPLRAGSDLVFLGALIRYILEERPLVPRVRRALHERVGDRCARTSRTPRISDGLFSARGDVALCRRAGRRARATPAQRGEGQGTPRRQRRSAARRNAAASALRVPGAEAPLRALHAGAGRAARAASRARRSSKSRMSSRALPVRRRRRAICYAVGWTQHSTGVQTIRAAAILQLLLGNIGRPGGGIMALRGHASIQGSTDIPTLYDILPGYLPMPTDEGARSRGVLREAQGGEGLVAQHRPLHGVAAEGVLRRRGDARRTTSAFGWLPRLTGDHSYFGYWLDMADGKLEGLFVMGQNPAVGSPNGKLERAALGKLKWLVVREMVETETAAFWQDVAGRHRHRGLLLSRGVARGEGGDVHEHAAPAAVARESRRSARRRAQRARSSWSSSDAS